MVNAYTPYNDDDNSIQYGRVSAGVFFGFSFLGMNALRGLDYEKHKKRSIDFILKNEEIENQFFQENSKKMRKANALDNRQRSTPSVATTSFLEQEPEILFMDDKTDNIRMNENNIVSDIVDMAYLEMDIEDRMRDASTGTYTSQEKMEGAVSFLQKRKESLQEQIEFIKNTQKGDPSYSPAIKVPDLQRTAEHIQDQLSKLESLGIQNGSRLERGLPVGESLFNTSQFSGKRQEQLSAIIEKNIRGGLYNDNELMVLAERGMVSEKNIKFIKDKLPPEYTAVLEHTNKYKKELDKKISSIFGKEIETTRTPNSLMVQDMSGPNKSPFKFPIVLDERTISFNGKTFARAQAIAGTGVVEYAPMSIGDMVESFTKTLDTKKGNPFVAFNDEAFARLGFYPQTGPLGETKVPFDTRAIARPESSFNEIMGNHSQVQRNNSIIGNINRRSMERGKSKNIGSLYLPAQSDQAWASGSMKLTTLGELASPIYGVSPTLDQRHFQQDIGAPFLETGSRTRKAKPFFDNTTIKQIAKESGASPLETSKFIKHAENAFLDITTLEILDGEQIADGQGKFVTGQTLDSIEINGKVISKDAVKVSMATTKATVAGSQSIEEMSGLLKGNIVPNDLTIVTFDGVSKLEYGAPTKGRNFASALSKIPEEDRAKALKILFNNDDSKVKSALETFQTIKKSVSNINDDGQSISLMPGSDETYSAASKRVMEAYDQLGRMQNDVVLKGYSGHVAKTTSTLREELDGFKPLKELFYFDPETGNVRGTFTKHNRMTIVQDAVTVASSNQWGRLDPYSLQRSGAFGRYIYGESVLEDVTNKKNTIKPVVQNNGDQIFLGKGTSVKYRSSPNKIRDFTLISPMMIDGYSPENTFDMGVLARYRKEVNELYNLGRAMSGKSSMNVNGVAPDDAAKLFAEKRLALTEKMMADDPDLLKTGTIFSSSSNETGSTFKKKIELNVSGLFSHLDVTKTADGKYILPGDSLKQYGFLSDILEYEAKQIKNQPSLFMNSKEGLSFLKYYSQANEFFGKRGVTSITPRIKASQSMAVEVDNFLDIFQQKINDELSKSNLSPEVKDKLKKAVREVYGYTEIDTVFTPSKFANKNSKNSNSFIARSPAINETTVSPVGLVVVDSMDEIKKILKHSGIDPLSKKNIKGLPVKTLEESIKDPYQRFLYLQDLQELKAVKDQKVHQLIDRKNLPEFVQLRERRKNLMITRTIGHAVRHSENSGEDINLVEFLQNNKKTVDGEVVINFNRKQLKNMLRKKNNQALTTFDDAGAGDLTYLINEALNNPKDADALLQANKALTEAMQVIDPTTGELYVKKYNSDGANITFEMSEIRVELAKSNIKKEELDLLKAEYLEARKGIRKKHGVSKPRVNTKEFYKTNEEAITAISIIKAAAANTNVFGVSINGLNKLDFDGDLVKLVSIPDKLKNLKAVKETLTKYMKTNSFDSRQDLTKNGIIAIIENINSIEGSVNLGEYGVNQTSGLVQNISSAIDNIMEEANLITTKSHNDKVKNEFADTLKKIFKKDGDLYNLYHQNLSPEEYSQKLYNSIEVKHQWERTKEKNKIFLPYQVLDADGKGQTVYHSINQALYMKGDIQATKKNGINAQALQVVNTTTSYEDGLKNNQISYEDAAKHFEMDVEDFKATGITEVHRINKVEIGGIKYSDKELSKPEIQEAIARGEDIRPILEKNFKKKAEPQEFSIDVFENPWVENDFDSLLEFNKRNQKIETEAFLENRSQFNKILKKNLSEIEFEIERYDNLKATLVAELESVRKDKSKTKILKRKIHDVNLQADEYRRQKVVNSRLGNVSDVSHIEKIYSENIIELNKSYAGEMKTQKYNVEEVTAIYKGYQNQLSILEQKRQNNEISKKDYDFYVSKLDQTYNIDQFDKQIEKFNLGRMFSSATMKESLPAYFKMQAQMNTYMDILSSKGYIDVKTQKAFGNLLAKVTQEGLNVKKTDAGNILLDFSQGAQSMVQEMLATQDEAKRGMLIEDIAKGDYRIEIDKVEKALKDVSHGRELSPRASQEYNAAQNNIISKLREQSVDKKSNGYTNFSEIRDVIKNEYGKDFDKGLQGKLYKTVTENIEEFSLEEILLEPFGNAANKNSKIEKAMKNRANKLINDFKAGMKKANSEISDFGAKVLNVFNAMSAEHSTLSFKDYAKVVRDSIELGIPTNMLDNVKRPTSPNVFWAKLLKESDDTLFGGKQYLTGTKVKTLNSALPLVGLGALAAYAMFGQRPRDTVSGKIRNNMDFVRSIEKSEDIDPDSIKYDIYKQTSGSPIVI